MGAGQPLQASCSWSGSSEPWGVLQSVWLKCLLRGGQCARVQAVQEKCSMGSLTLVASMSLGRQVRT